jgi:UDP-N-acetylmuramate dehydrogenase
MISLGARRTPSLLDSADRSFLRERFGERARFDESLAPYTSWKIGGPADVCIAIETSAELADLLRWSFKRRLPRFVLGSGSNVLIGDGGIRGIVIRLGGEFAAIDVSTEAGSVVVSAGASASLALLTAQAASKGAVGIGSLAGIPGSVGGALRMNAGTDKEIGDFVRDVWVQSPTKPDPHPISVQYFYRHSSIGRDAIVARVRLAFPQGDPADVRADMNARLRRRKETQPLQFPNAGSCFRNPPGDKAGRLIEAVGAKGWRVGGAEVSALHANFIVNVDSATALDVATLLARVRRAVLEQFGVELQPEVHMVGEFLG